MWKYASNKSIINVFDSNKKIGGTAMIRIYADSTNDLGAELIEKNKVRIVPLYVRMGEETVKDGPSLDPDELYA